MLSVKTKEKTIEKFRAHDTDTGSAEVQAAVLTKHINELTVHCQANPKDFSSKRGLLNMVNQRKDFLRYLEKTNEDKYKQTISRLGLRK